MEKRKREEKHDFRAKLPVELRGGIEGLKRTREEKQDLSAKVPVELWGEIGKRIGSRIGVACFRSVCKVWRSSLPPPTRFPLRVPSPPGVCEKDPFRKPLCLISQIETYKVDNRYLSSFEIRPMRPGKYRSSRFPPWGYRHRDKCFDFSDQHSRLSLVCTTYGMYWDLYKSGFCRPRLRSNLFKMVLISSKANAAVDPNYASLSDLSLVALVDKGQLALLRLTDSDWNTNFYRHPRAFVSIAVCNGQLCAVDCAVNCFVMDYDSLQMTEVAIDVFKHAQEQHIL